MSGLREQERPKALRPCLESLRKTRDLPAEIVLPGPEGGHGSRLADRQRRLGIPPTAGERRKIYDLIAEEPRSGYELAQALFGNVAVTQAYLTLSKCSAMWTFCWTMDRVSETRSGWSGVLPGE